MGLEIYFERFEWLFDCDFVSRSDKESEFDNLSDFCYFLDHGLIDVFAISKRPKTQMDGFFALLALRKGLEFEPDFFGDKGYKRCHDLEIGFEYSEEGMIGRNFIRFHTRFPESSPTSPEVSIGQFFNKICSSFDRQIDSVAF